jgi:hypothetical protein
MLTLQLKPPTQHHWPINELARFAARTAVLRSGALLSRTLMRSIDDPTSAVPFYRAIISNCLARVGQSLMN